MKINNPRSDIFMQFEFKSTISNLEVIFLSKRFGLDSRLSFVKSNNFTKIKKAQTKKNKIAKKKL